MGSQSLKLAAFGLTSGCVPAARTGAAIAPTEEDSAMSAVLQVVLLDVRMAPCVEAAGCWGCNSDHLGVLSSKRG